MELSNADLSLIDALGDGLDIVTRPYATLGAHVGLSEQETIQRLQSLIERGVIRRFGVIVHHHRLGLRANGMSVWDIPDDRVAEVGRRMGAFPCVTLCYRRPRRLPDWPYNLFAMVHGKQREQVLAQVDDIAYEMGLSDVAKTVLFSNRQFKQRGAHYRSGLMVGKREAAE